MNQRSFINLLITCLWCLALLCGFILLSWSLHLGWIDRLHAWTTDRFIEEPSRIYADIVRQQSRGQDPGKTTDALEDLLNRLGSVQKNDVLDPLKRTILWQLVWTYQQQNDLPSALQWATYWRAFDPWDLNAQIEWASIMMASPDTYEVGKSNFEALVQRFPELLSITTGYARGLAKSGHFAEALLLFSPFLQELPGHSFVKTIGSLPDMDWEVRLLSDTDSTPRTSLNWATSESNWTLSVQAGLEVNQLVFQIPATSIIDLHSVTIIVNETRHNMPFSAMQQEGFIARTDHLWKPDYGPATLSMFPPTPNSGAFKVVVEPSIATPEVLVKLIQPPIGPLTLSQLESSHADSVGLFHLAQAMLAPRNENE